MQDEETIIIKYFAFLNRMYEKYSPLPDLDINEREWSAFFDTIYEHTAKKNENNFYYGYLYVITIAVLNQACLKDDNYITLNDFIENTDVLNYLGFSEKEISLMKAEIISKSSFGKIIMLKH